MSYYIPYRRLLAMALSIVMVLGILPVPAAAQELSGGTNGEIIAFETLPEETATQTVPLGTSLESLDLPGTLTAVAHVATASDAETPEQDSGEQEGLQESEQTTQSISVIWSSEPEYDGNTAGVYTFAPSVELLEGLTLADGVSAPTITVTVAMALTLRPIMAQAASNVDTENYAFDAGTGTLTIKTNGGATGLGTPTSWRSDTNFAAGDVKSVIFLDGVTDIRYNAFSNCPTIESVTIPSSVFVIRGDAFANCTGLSSLTLTEGLKSIEYTAFGGCTGLTSLTLPASVIAMGNGAFMNSTALTLTLTGGSPPTFAGPLWAKGVPHVYYPASWGTSVPNLNAEGNAYAIVDIQAIPGIVAPVQGNTPVSTIAETAQYTGSVTWSPADKPFQANTAYTATITLTPKAGCALTGVAANFFTVAGATNVSNAANSGVVTAQFPSTGAYSITEQFNLTPGGTYYFDMSGQSLAGANPLLPDTSQHWVPFTYAGTVNAYSRTSAGVSTAEGVSVNDRSLFIADYILTSNYQWDHLSTWGYIFGTSYSRGGVSYLLRSLSAGSADNGLSGAVQRGNPVSNEWDQILNKNSGYIKNWSGVYSWGQDTIYQEYGMQIFRSRRGDSSARNWSSASYQGVGVGGYRPALEITSAPGTELKTVTYDMNGKGTLGSGSLTSATVVYTGTLTLPAISSTNGFYYAGTGDGTLGWYAGGTFYTPGATPVLATGTTLTAGYSGIAPSITTTSLPGGTVSTAYSQTLAATGTAPITWSIDSGSLPGGLSLNGSTGEVSGTPTTAGTFSFTVKAANSAGSQTKALSITISLPPAPPEQFSLALGGTYYFNLSAQGVLGTINTNLPDTSMKWVPFTYAGTVTAYSLDASSSGNTSASANAAASDRSLFVADYNISHTVSWDALNGAGLIFGKAYNPGGVACTLRSLAGGSNKGSLGGTPETNEWDQVLNKNGAYLKNWSGIFSWGQDTSVSSASFRALRGYGSARGWYDGSSSPVYPYLGFRPTLEILNPDTLDSDGLKTVTYDMNGNGTLGSGSLTSATVVYTGTLTLPEIRAENGFHYTGTGDGELGWYAGTTFYAPGATPSLPAGTILTPGYSGTAPTITGPATLTLTEGYDATATGMYTITGTAPVAVTKTSGDAMIVWNDATKKLDVAAGLAAGNYTVTLKASNGILPDATWTFTLTVNAASVIDAAISPASASYDLASPTDVSTNITWNSAATVTDVVYGTTPLASPTDYVVSGSALTIKNDYLSMKGFSAGDKAEFTISFNKGASATLTVNIVNNYTPGSNADLSDLTVGGSTVSGFDPGILTYTVELPHGTQPGSASATVGATAADSKTGVIITQASSLPGSVTVEVTAEDGTATKTYTVNLTLKAAPPVQSSEKEVTSVTDPIGAVIRGTNITATVANSVSSQVINLSVSAKASWEMYRDASCTSEITGKTMTLSVGANTAYVQVTAESGSTKVYTLTITRQINGGTSGGGGSGYTLEPPKPVILTDKQPNMPTVAKMSIPGTVNNDVLSVTITEQMAKEAIKAAQDAAKKSGKEADGIALGVNVTGSGSYTSLNAVIDAGVFDRLKEAGVNFIKIGSAVLDVSFNTGAITEIDKQSTGAVTVSAQPPTKLSDAAKALIGSRPAFDITVSYLENGKTAYVSDFGEGAVTLGIAYKATDKESTGNLFGVYVDKNGKPQLLANSGYVNGRVIFERNSLSSYGVGYKAPAPVFTDTEKHWAKDSIDFVAGRGIISGTSATTFAPNTATTRADFLMALGRLSGADVSSYKLSSFTDVKSSNPAMPYIEWAVTNQIVQGIGNKKFAPDQKISRQGMAVMILNYAKATGYKLPVSVAAVTFSDSTKIGAYAKDAVIAIQQAGIMQGKNNNVFDPAGSATRAEASTILRRFIELVIDEVAARG